MDSAVGRHSDTRTEQPAAGLDRSSRVIAALATALTIALVAWIYLVWLAIDFGARARAGTGGEAWWLLAATSLGAMACLFLALIMLTRLGRVWGVGVRPSPDRLPGGRRRAR